MGTTTRGNVFAGLLLITVSCVFFPSVCAALEKGPEYRSITAKETVVDGAFYKYLEQYIEKRTARYFAENAKLKYIARHIEISENGFPGQGKGEQPILQFAKYGHWLEPGNGLVAVQRETVESHVPFQASSSSYAVEQLTIVFPKGLASQSERYVIGPNKPEGPLIFWSVWEHSGFTCFGYAEAGGTIEAAEYSMSQEIAPSQRELFVSTPFVRTLTVQLKVEIQAIWDEGIELFKSEANPKCKSFEIDKSLEFYWRPLSLIVEDYQ